MKKTNDELKKKIVEIIINAIWKDAEAGYDSTDETEACSIADALIAAGLKFDTVVSHTATFDIMQQEQISRLEIRVAEAEHRAEVAELVVKNLNDTFTFNYQYVFEQAEKELQEEREDEQN